MASKVAHLREYDVSEETGAVIDRNASTTTIKQMLKTRKEWRVVPDADNANTTGYPTIAAYLSLEHTAGRTFKGMIGNSLIVTQT
jgi:hypothetical protein